MTPEQKRDLLAACEAEDDVAMVTLGLQIAAWNARAGLRDTAMTCRRLVDELRSADDKRSEYMQRRLEIATVVSPSLITEGPREDASAEAVRYADALLSAISSIGIGE